MTDPLPGWVAHPALAALWQQVRQRFEAAGLVAVGRTMVVLSSREERHAAGSLLGAPTTRDRITVDLAVLDERLRLRSGVGGLREVLPLVIGGPLQDRPGRRVADAETREAPLAMARALVDAPWAEDWVAGLRRSGLLTRRPDAERLVRDAARVLAALTTSPTSENRSRVELAADIVGDAHALDQDRPLHQIVLRGLAAASGVAVPAAAGDRRALWASYAVVPDLVSRTCLVLGVSPEGADGGSRRLRLAADAGDPVHVTDWDLRRLEGSWTATGPVLLCENPRVLEAVAERHAGRHPVVCTSGEPNTVVTSLVAQLAGSGVELRYHGDFDWPGIAIANRLVARFGVQPWLMGAADYERAARTDAPPLAGTPVDPVWDEELGPAMRGFGRAVHEESVLPDLLERLG